MRTHAWRQLLVTSRMAPVWIAAGGSIGLLAAYLAVWGDGVPVVGARDVLDQFAGAQGVLLVLLVPWVVARSSTLHDRDTVARLAAQTGQRPSAVALGASLGTAAAACAVAWLGVPLLLMSQQIAARPAVDLLAGVARLGVLAVAAAVATSTCVTLRGNALQGWMAGCVLTAGMTWLLPAGGAGIAAGLLLVAAGAAIVQAYANAAWLHVEERRP